MKPSATNALNAKIDELRKQGRKIYNFAKGDLVLPNHPLILEAVQKVIDEGHSPYAPVAGLSELRAAAAQWMNERYGSDYKEAETVVTTGGKFAVFASLQVLIEPGDEVIIQAPYWVSFPEMVKLANGTPVIVQTRWKLTPELLKAAITPKTRVLILNNGCNPTGILYSKEELNALLNVAKSANLWVISDEVYSELVFEGKYHSLATFAEHKERTIIIESCSKNFAMAGWRVGFAFGPKSVIDQIIALQSQSTTGTSFISQKAALAAIRNSPAVSKYVRDRLSQKRKVFFDTLSQLTNTKIEPPPAGIYYFTKIGPVEEILDQTGIALVPGEAFGTPGYARFSFAETEEEIVEGLNKLKKYL